MAAPPAVPVHLRGMAGVPVRSQDNPVPGKLPCLKQSVRRHNPHMPADPLLPLPAGFTPWYAPYPFQGKGDWNVPFVPVLRAEEARIFDNILQELRLGNSLGFDKHADTNWELGLTTALNAMNSAVDQNAKGKPWAYFAPITIVRDSSAPNNKPSPNIHLPARIYSDIDIPWTTAHLPVPFRNDANLPRYRYVVFIHRHKARGAANYSSPIYTMSVLDREHGRLDWFDTQSHEQWREDDITNFWTKVDTNFPTGPNNTVPPSTDILYYNNLPLTTNLADLNWTATGPPRAATLWTVLGLALECASPMELCNGEPIFQKGEDYSIFVEKQGLTAVLGKNQP
ncbi:hypothetical protein LQW54_008763 [Pestalotiopsis sp. IQ-011]